MDADSAFKELTKRSGVLFREHGFKGSGQNFRRACGGGGEGKLEQWQLINFQRSQWRLDNSEPISFYLNIGVYFPGIEKPRLQPVEGLAKLSESKADLRLRAGDFLPDGKDDWLGVDGPGLEAFWKRFATLLTGVILPGLEAVRTPEGMERAMRRVPWMADWARAWLAAHGRSIHTWAGRDAAEAAGWKQDKDGLWWHERERNTR